MPQLEFLNMQTRIKKKNNSELSIPKNCPQFSITGAIGSGLQGSGLQLAEVITLSTVALASLFS